MRGSVLAISTLAACLGACSLLVSTDGLSGGAPDAGLGGDAAVAHPGADATTDATPGSDAASSGGGPDATTSTSSITLVQSQATGTAGPKLLAVDFPKPVTAGNTLVVALNVDDDRNVSSVTDTAGDTFRPVASGQALYDEHAAVYVATQAVGGATKVTVQADGATDLFFVGVLEYSGIGQNGAVLATTGSTTAVDSMATGALVPTPTEGDLLVGFGNAATFSDEGTENAGAGFTAVAQTEGAIVEQRFLHPSDSANATATMASGNKWVMIGVIFHAAQ